MNEAKLAITANHIETRLERIYYRHYSYGDQSSRKILFFHNAGEHHRLYHDFLLKLTDEKTDVIGVDLPGHGLSSGERFYIDDFYQYREFFEQVIEQLYDPERELFVIADGLSSLISLIHLEQGHDQRLKKIVLISPYIKLKKNNKVELLTRLLAKSDQLAESLRYLRLEYLPVREDYDYLCSTALSYQLIDQVIQMSHKVLLTPYLIHNQICILVGGLSRLFNPQMVEIFASTMDKDLVKLINYSELNENLLKSELSDLILSDIKQWL